MHENSTKTTKTKIILIIGFVIFAITLFFLLDNKRNQTLKQHLQRITERYLLAYKTIYDQHERLATNLYSGIVDRFKILDMYQLLITADDEQKNKLHDDLFMATKPCYKELRNEGKVRQLHFHLKNNESFLRLHRPEKFCDNLANIRDTVNFVNTMSIPEQSGQ